MHYSNVWVLLLTDGKIGSGQAEQARSRAKGDLGYKCSVLNLETLKGVTDACSELWRGEKHDFQRAHW